jgi:hypothetical protein
MAKIPLVALSVAICLVAPPALAQIKEPGAHPHYFLELEPHFTVEWDGGPDYFGQDGIGLGARASIPLFHNGPISSINNSMAITFGFDWVHFGYDQARACRDFRGTFCAEGDFSASALWVPVALQWNFFVHPSISVFGELGLALLHERWSWARPCPGMPGPVCTYNESDTHFARLVFYPGARFMVSERIGITVRVGYPHLTAGVSFLL